MATFGTVYPNDTVLYPPPHPLPPLGVPDIVDKGPIAAARVQQVELTVLQQIPLWAGGSRKMVTNNDLLSRTTFTFSYG